MSGSDQPQAGQSPLRRALLKLDELQAKIDALEGARREPLAIVGLACRFPGGSLDADAFWTMLSSGRDGVCEIPADRWDIDTYYDPNPGVPGKMYTRRGAFLDSVAEFDPQHFGIAPREAISMDPQQRLLLEVAWEALEDAGQAPDRLSGSRTGVFIGICRSDYSQLQLKLDDPARFDAYQASGCAHSIASGRLSYVLGLQGPSVSIDTACSSSLVAIHLAAQSLRGGECRMALVGGVNLILSPENTLTFCQSTMVSRDGCCRTFDAAADGFGQGEGCGMLVIKRLRDAIADGNRVRALILGTAVNQDGPSSGLTAPNGPAQEAMLREALDASGVAPNQVSYVEAHGTATSLGDPIEVQALGAVMRQARPADRPLLIGSVKTNIGHLEAAAGVAGVIKVVLGLEHKQVAPHLHFTTPNPHIAWADLPVEVPTTLRQWEPVDGRRIAGVSSFGFSGTNAHVMLEEAPAGNIVGSDESPAPSICVCTLSARSETALAAVAQRYSQWLDEHPDASVADVCRTANVGRARFRCRAALVADSAAQLRERLQSLIDGVATDGVITGRPETGDPPKLAFLFTGQGSQYVQMGRSLFEGEPVFRDVLTRCDALLRNELPKPLLSVLYPEGSDPDRLLDQTAFTQPALFAIEYALAELWRSWGIRPSYVMGHSLGEYVAACVAGVFSLEDALGLVAGRARLMQALPAAGRMAAIFTAERRVAEAIARCRGEVAIAAVNGPEHVVISGCGSVVESIVTRLDAEGVRTKFLNVSHAFHSPLMAPAVAEFERVVETVDRRPPRIALISNVTAERAGRSDLLDPHYWGRHALEPVRFGDSIATLSRVGCRLFVEIGPDPVLLGMAARSQGEGEHVWLPSLRKGQDDLARMFTSLAHLHVRGADVDWDTFERPHGGRRISLPTYPFERERCWFEGARRTQTVERTPAAGSHPLLGSRVDTARDTVFTAPISSETVPFLADHVVHGHTVLPTTAYLEMAATAASELLGVDELVIEQLTLQRALSVSNGPTTVQLLVSRQANDLAFELFSRRGEPNATNGGGEWILHATGALRAAVEDRAAEGFDRPDDVRRRCVAEIAPSDLYAGLFARGLQFGPRFKRIERLWRRDGEAIGEIAPPSPADERTYRLHPADLDACLQVLAAAAPGFVPADTTTDIYMPIAVDRFVSRPSVTGRLTSHVWFDAGSDDRPDTRVGHVRVFDEFDRCVAELRAIQMKRVDEKTLRRVLGSDIDDWFYEVKWRAADADAATRPSAAASLDERFARLGAAHGVHEGRGSSADLDAIVAAYVVAALRRLGWTPAVGEAITAGNLARRLAVVPRYERLLGRFLEMLAEDTVLEGGPMYWTVRSEPPVRNVERMCAALIERDAAREPELTVTRRCGERLADVLRGEADPLALLFPGGNIDATAGIYNQTPVARTFNALCAQLVVEEIDRRPVDRPVRILEIGAGTGATADSVLDALPPGRAEYVFTDIGQAFLTRAARRYANRANVRFGLLDIERDPASQGFAGGAFDIIIASNVLHATRDIRATLRHVRQLLDPAGMLLLLEGTAPQRWFDLTFGLTDGWWRFSDLDLRPAYPLMSRDRWIAVLGEMGFAPAAAPSSGTAPHALFAAAGPQHPSRSRASELEQDCWIVLADEGVFGEEFARTLRERGDGVVLVSPGASFQALAPDHFVVDPLSADDFARLIREALLGRRCRGAVHLWALSSPEELWLAQSRGCGAALHLAQALLDADVSGTPALWLVTRGAQPAATAAALTVAGAPLWGLGRVIALEHPELRCRRIDLDPAGGPADVAPLIDELYRNSHEDEDAIAFREGQRLVARLTRAVLHESQSPLATPDGEPVELYVSAKGSPDGVRLRPVARRAPGPGEVEIRVRAAGLNFRDVLNVLGMRDDTDPLGGECAGVVTRTGEGVRNIAVGDEVVAVASGAFSTFALLRHEVVGRKPVRLTFEEAAGIPLAYLTASYALRTIGGLARGERVLIHAAAGGVGLAAVKIAQRVGAEVFATAGSVEKRRYLESIGVVHVMDSRSLDFADEIRQLTNGEGVDVVLNALTGEAIARGISVLRRGGRFVEIGKSEIWDDGRVRAVNPNVRYVAVDLAERLHRDPDSVRPLLLELIGDVDAGRLDPLPVSAFPLADAAEAFRYMARARHIGKIVLVPPSAGGTRARREVAFRPGATYLITGAFGGLGLELARWMAARGARHLALMGRRAPNPDAERALLDVTEAGARTLVLRGDVSNRDDVASALERIDREMPPLAGIVHAAGVLRDGVLLQQNWAQFTEVLAPKVQGAWNLHELTRDRSLELFVLFSSVSSLLGSPGQSNHAAANAFLDQLAHYRRTRGLPAVSINWGAWTDVGAAARHGVSERIAAHGVSGFSPADGLRSFERILRSDPVQVGVTPVDWQTFTRTFLRGRIPAFLAEVAAAPEAPPARGPVQRVSAATKETADLRTRLDQALPARRRQVLVAHVEKCAARVLGLPAGRPVDRRLPLAEMGLDSLMAVELRNTLATDVGSPLPATLLFDYPTVDALSDFLAAEVLALEDRAPRGALASRDRGPAGHDVLALIENFSDEDVERLLTRGEVAE